MMTKVRRLLIPALALIAAALFFLAPSGSMPAEEISRARLDRLMREGAIISAEITPEPFHQVYRLKGFYRHAPGAGQTEFQIATHLDAAQLESLLAKGTVSMALPQKQTRSKFMDIAPTLLIAGVVVGVVLYQSSYGRARSIRRVRHRPTVRLADVAGIEEAKHEVQEVVDFLRHPEKFNRLGGSLPKGILLVGPPGTGKTMLAKAIAGEANASFFSASGSDFTEIFVGVGAKRVRDLFRQARKRRPAIIFIDEIDCLGKNRKHDQNGEMQQTNNALLTEMDGFDTSEGIIVIAATNRPEDLDEALLRPGRFDRKVHVPLPDTQGRRAILAAHGKRTSIRAADEALATLAQTTPGMSGADLANLINEAAILSARRDKTEITITELEEARDKVRFGQERKSMILREEERRVVAYHEAGHAIIYLCGALLPPLHKVSIVPRGQSLGSTTVLPREDQNIHGRKFLIEQMAVLMGGRAAEEIFFGDMTNGANGDLDTAKNIARKMIHDWGMGERLYYQPDRNEAEMEINLILTNAWREATELVKQHRQSVKTLAEALLVQDTLDREEVFKLLNWPAAKNGSAALAA